MSVKADLERLVQLQARELELLELDAEIERIASERRRLEAEVAASRAAVEAARAELDSCQKEIRRLEMELKTAEEQVRKYKDRLLEVKTNKELWALQEEIKGAEASVGDVEEKSIVQMELADDLEQRITTREKDLGEVESRVRAALAEADEREAEVRGQQEKLRGNVEALRSLVPDDLLKRYDGLKEMRAGIGVAEVRDGVCLACNFTLRPQLYMEVRNFSGFQQCENCNRIAFVRETLDLPAADAGAPPGQDGADPSAASTGSS